VLVLSQIGIAQHGVIDPVGEVGYAYGQGQLDNLFFREVLTQLLQLLVADRGRGARDLVGKMNDSLIFLIEQLAAMVEDQGANLIVGNSNPLRRSGVRLGSILAPIDN